MIPGLLMCQHRYSQTDTEPKTEHRQSRESLPILTIPTQFPWVPHPCPAPRMPCQGLSAPAVVALQQGWSPASHNSALLSHGTHQAGPTCRPMAHLCPQGGAQYPGLRLPQCPSAALLLAGSGTGPGCQLPSEIH